MDLHCFLWPILLVTIDVCQSVLIDLSRYRGAIVHLHNRYRSMERAASDMKELVYSKTCLKRPPESRQTKILMTNGSLMKVESIAECSLWGILQNF